MTPLKQYKLMVTAVAVVTAETIVEAISEEDAVEIARTSLKPEDFEPEQIVNIASIELMEKE